MESKSIRGIAKTISDGSTKRPDFVGIDDPQTDRGALNQNTCRRIIKAITKTIKGLKLVGEQMGVAIAATVIETDDAMHQMLDIEDYPEFRGSHVKMLPEMPSEEALKIWDGHYRKLYKQAFVPDIPDYSKCNKYYREHYGDMTDCVESSWPDMPVGELVDSIQYAMHEWLRDEEAFWCEYQNEPGGYIKDDDIRLRIGHVLDNLNGYKKHEKPEGFETETMCIDINFKGLNVAHCFFKHDLTGVVADYFEFTPDDPITNSPRGYVFKEGLNIQEDEEITKALYQLVKREYAKHPECYFGIDGNNWPELVHNVVKRLKREGITNIYILRGRSWKHYKIPQSSNSKKLIRKPGTQCHYYRGPHGPEIPFDSNWWHLKTQSCFKIMNPARGSLSLWGSKSLVHQEYALECIGETYYKYNPNDYIHMYEKYELPGQDVDKFDSTSMCQILANILGCRFDYVNEPKKKKKYVSMSDRQKKSKKIN